NLLVGLGGNDTLDGGAGNDTMQGGTGNDTYFVDNTSDVVSELAGEGTDTVTSSVSLALAAGGNVENLVLIGAATVGTGNELDNMLAGNGNSNTLDGGLGNDTMTGGASSDTYFVDSVGDVVVEVAGGGTADLVKTTLNSYTLPGEVEQLTFIGSGDFTGTG